jgi:16S rRNA (uracil1498-N3)-methyltransferase
MSESETRRTPRFFVPADLSLSVEIELPERAARHCSVLRLHRGEPVVVFNGDGSEFLAELTGDSRDVMRARLVSKRAPERESPLAIELAQCVSSGDRMDLALQKSTELGISRIVPIASARSIVKLAGQRADRRVTHWRNVVIAACEQCGRNRVPEVTAIMDLHTFLAATTGERLRLLLAPDATQELKALTPAAAVTLLVGPEGGLSLDERRSAEGSGFIRVRFGPRVLRTETASLAAIAAMQALWGDC